ncbi:activating transcription factor 7-interacting protein 1 [Bradysia coprophila]|uniref:activating transcription factor 7-interacting protein 1 n=1 Tax=Bradysia coprophila TaxID=38358 RepID=UPI00187DD580|nr:activating transcription factor 7-interacting protein 1 [Bradysia coprophila]
MMDIHESAQEFRHLAVKSSAPTVSDEDEEMVLNYSDSEDDHSSKNSKSETLKDEVLDLLDKDNQMKVADDDYSDKKQNGTISETGSNDKQTDVVADLKDFFPVEQTEDEEKMSLLDRFLSSEVVENGKENITELIGDELVDEAVNEVIDENALLDEITNDLDQEELDEECLLDEDNTETESKGDAVTSTEVTDSKPVDESADGEENSKTIPEKAAETSIEDSSEAASVEQMEVDDHESPVSTEDPSEKETEIVDRKVEEKSVESTAIELETDCTVSASKVDDDNDNNLLEEMIDSPRSSEHESMTSEVLEKEDTVAHDFNEDEKLEQQLIVQSSNDNSNMSESGALTPEMSSGADIKFKHDGELHIMDDAGDANVPSDEVIKEPKVEIDVNVTCKQEEVEPVESVKKEIEDENVGTDEAVDQTSSDGLEKANEESISIDANIAKSPEPVGKRKCDSEIDAPENKKKRIEETSSNSDNVGVTEDTMCVDNDIDIADESNDVTALDSTDNNVQKESDTNKDDDDDVLIVGETKQTEKAEDSQVSTAPKIQEPVQKAKILILDTQAIAKDLCDETVDTTSGAEVESTVHPENDSEVSSSQKDAVIEKEAETSVEKNDETSETRTKAPSKFTLDPAPQKTLSPTAFSLDFVRTFKKNFDKMTRNDLEELLIQKCVEVIVHKSDYADMRNKIEKQESKLQSFSTKYQELSKQYRDLEMVHQRVIKDMELKNQSVVTPVKITRAVGLQVSLPRKEITVQKPPPPAAQANNAVLAQQNAALAKNRRKVLPQRPNDPNANIQQQQQIMRQNMMLARRNEVQMQQRNQFHPQQQQQQGQNNLLKQQLIQNNSPNNNLRQPGNIRKQFSPVATNQMQNSSPKNPAPAERRVPPVILKKMTPTRISTISMTPGSNTTLYSSQSKIANTSITRSSTASSSMNNLIDLTDEEDSKRVAQNGTNPPALVAIPNNHGNKTVVGQGKVNFVTVKPGTPQAQLQMVQQNRLASMHKVGGAYVPIAPKSNGTTGQIVQLARKQQPATTLTPVQRRQHPAPLPYPNNQPTNPYWKLIPPRPIIRINKIETGIVISWTMDEITDQHAVVASYQIYAYQETSAAPSPETWRHVGDVKAMLLPMAVTLTQFQEGQQYHFAVRAVDEHSRYGIFSLPKTWT